MRIVTEWMSKRTAAEIEMTIFGFGYDWETEERNGEIRFIVYAPKEDAAVVRNALLWRSIGVEEAA